ncbi:carbohydrate-binding protein [Streptosporangium sp. NPDC001559]|uniref:carbohydrate-binding protein n=1 Tax=Streptosporangium sp. NPDC001559 TaxID=3366187 RepID=UPI0036F032E8
MNAPLSSVRDVTAWEPGVAYKVGDLVMYGGHLYQCRQAHTSRTGWEPPNVPPLWALVE